MAYDPWAGCDDPSDWERKNEFVEGGFFGSRPLPQWMLDEEKAKKDEKD